ncbi:hypothetical protein [Limosilactobacillus mucosae]|uniref:Uncharacterized protein n=1 Tax=Limosilactobacillus mucosae TaxID=97478 RepID=A0AAJ1HQQ5_LIMMU|nr:hypothetical protein [Limosilactobacillus mucosae]MDC2828468.1 hypothetical protein [Limosilactobacillus mucosae]MDC2834366.1 hypothetical protein [Limosilactobacillus mucosae]
MQKTKNMTLKDIFRNDELFFGKAATQLHSIVQQHNWSDLAERKDFRSFKKREADLYTIAQYRTDGSKIVTYFVGEIIPEWFPKTVTSMDDLDEDTLKDYFSEYQYSDYLSEKNMWKSNLKYRVVCYAYEYQNANDEDDFKYRKPRSCENEQDVLWYLMDLILSGGETAEFEVL